MTKTGGFDSIRFTPGAAAAMIPDPGVRVGFMT